MFKVTTPQSSPAKAVVIMYGWLGAKPKQVQKYADLYVQRGCIVVYGTASIQTIMLRRESYLTAAVKESIQEAAKAIRRLETAMSNNNDTTHTSTPSVTPSVTPSSSLMVPVVLHYFSNGGAFLAEKLYQLISSNEQKKGFAAAEADNDNDNADLILVADRLATRGFEVADSAPAFLHDNVYARALEQAIPNQPLLLVMSKSLLWFAFKLSQMLGRESVQNEFWKNMITSNLCERQAFIYSVADKLTDSKKIDELIETRKERGVEIISARFDDSDHVMHMRKYPKEYGELLDKVIVAIGSVKHSRE